MSGDADTPVTVWLILAPVMFGFLGLVILFVLQRWALIGQPIDRTLLVERIEQEEFEDESE